MKNNTKDNSDKLGHEARIWLKKTIIREHPEWIDEKGNCQRCYQMYSNLADIVNEIKRN